MRPLDPADPARAAAAPGGPADGDAGDRADVALFVYGTLLFGEIVAGLIGRRPASVGAVVPGWRAARLPGRVYPGLVPAPGRYAAGLLLSGLSAAEWAVFDAFEGEEYLLGRIATAAGGVALTYVLRDESDVAATDWNRSWFEVTHLARYVDVVAGWRAR